jgi:hypothetical protein
MLIGLSTFRAKKGKDTKGSKKAKASWRERCCEENTGEDIKIIYKLLKTVEIAI